jgi:hypothetical protein
MFACILVLLSTHLLGLGLELPYEVNSWPLDEDVMREVDAHSKRVDVSPDVLRDQAVALEQREIVTADLVFIGTCQPDRELQTESPGPFDVALIELESCLSGDCADTISLYRSSTSSRIAWTMPLGARPLDWSPPEPGRRYLFLARADNDIPWVLFGGHGHERYELSDGVVIGKGVPEKEFIADVVRLLEAAESAEPGNGRGEGIVQPSN